MVEQFLKNGHGWTPLRGRFLVIYLRNTLSTAKISFFYSWYFRIPPSPPCKAQAQEVLGLFVLEKRFAFKCVQAFLNNSLRPSLEPKSVLRTLGQLPYRVLRKRGCCPCLCCREASGQRRGLW